MDCHFGQSEGRMIMENKDWKIHIPGKTKKHASESKPVKLSAEAYNNLVDCYNETTLSMKELASILINEAIKHIAYDKED